MNNEELAPFEEKLVCMAKEEGVILVVPWQNKRVKVEKLPLGTLDQLKSHRDDFTPTRLVINFEVKDDETDDPLRDFVRPIELQVAYTGEDVRNANGLDKLRMGFWEEEQGRWIAFTEEKHGFRLQPCDPDYPEMGGFGFATVSHWGDAHIGAGN